LAWIADLYEISLNELLAWNGLNTSSVIRPGQRLLLMVTPPATPTQTPAPPEITPTITPTSLLVQSATALPNTQPEVSATPDENITSGTSSWGVFFVAALGLVGFIVLGLILRMKK
jgi:LysM repeat protein